MKRRSFFQDFPELETEALALVELNLNHTHDVLAHFSTKSVTQYLDITHMETIEDAQHLINFLHTRFTQERGIRWGIVHKSEAKIIGTCGYNTWTKRKFSAEIGYDISEPYRRQKFATEAVNAIVDFGFTTMELLKIEAFILPENSASVSFVQQLGFEWDSRVRDYQVSSGTYAYMECFSLKKHDWISKFVQQNQ
ncbi:MAG: GNAT family N-acetyltransferase [Chloroflexota bacterium]